MGGIATMISAEGGTIGSKELNILSQTASFSIGDSDDYDMYLLEHGNTTKEIIVELPLLANNQGKIKRIKAVGDGIARFYGNGGTEQSEGKVSQYIMSNNDEIWVLAAPSEWKILKHTLRMRIGGFNMADWTSRNIGSVIVTMDNVVGTYEIGELVKEYSDAAHTTPTGRYGRVRAFTATTLTLMFCDGLSTFTNNYYLLGQNSGATSDVNGNSKDVSTGLYHYTGYQSKDFHVSVRWGASTTFVESTAIALHQATTDTINHYGVAIIDKSSDYFIIQTASGGVEIQSDGGIGVLSTQNYSADVYIERSV
jgi:hypothetical protein